MPVIPLAPAPDDPNVDKDPFAALRAGFEQDRQRRSEAQQQGQTVIEGGAGLSVSVGSGGRYTVSKLADI